MKKKNDGYAHKYNAQKPVVFIHVPKAAGSTCRKVFGRWFGAQLITHYINTNTGAQPLLYSPQDPKLQEPGVCIFGHFNRERGCGLETSYPWVEQFVTILRDPFESAISNYFYVKKESVNWKQKPPYVELGIEDYLKRVPVNMLGHFPKIVTWDNYRAVVDSFIYVGLTEDLRSSIKIMSSLLDKRVPLWLPRDNVTLRYQTVDPNLRADFKHRNALEFAVYEYARNRHFERLHSTLPVPAWHQVFRRRK